MLQTKDKRSLYLGSVSENTEGLGPGFSSGADIPGVLSDKVPFEDDPDYVEKAAHYLHSHGHKIDPSGDKAVNAYLKFFSYYSNTTEEDLLFLQNEYRDYYRALRLMKYAGSDIRGGIIKAGVISDTPISDIANYTGLPESTVGLFERVYFNVRDKLDKEGYVFGKLLHRVVSAEETANEEDVWCFLAYIFGWNFFKDYLSAEDSTRIKLSRAVRYREARKVLMATHSELSSEEVLTRYTRARHTDGITSENETVNTSAEDYAKIDEVMNRLEITNIAAEDDPAPLPKEERRLLSEGLDKGN
jgi:hypothetical protein